MSTAHPASLDRRRFLATCSALGLGGLFPGALWALASRASAQDAAASGSAPAAAVPAAPPAARITADMIDDAARLAGIEIAPGVREAMLRGLETALDDFEAVRKLALPNAVAPAFVFDPLPRDRSSVAARPGGLSRPSVVRAQGVPARLEDLCFEDVLTLGDLLGRRKVSSLALTEMFLDRLERLDPQLRCVVTLTRDRAVAQAREADRDMARGRRRGPLHGIPWGAKDILAVKGYPTTWGARGFETQSFDEDAEVVKRLDRAGAVLLAKLSVGALAMGDRWFGGVTRNPWRLEQGSSGSSAGSASAVAAGCMPFAVGTETLGSISSPSTRCGVTGLRPTFGRVPRTGAMALSWTMDKIGPIARRVEDCALVLEALSGPDGADATARDVPFAWDARRDWRSLRVGWVRSAFADPEGDSPAAAAARADRAFDLAALQALRGLGVRLVEVELPDMPWGAMVQILVAEAAAAFDDLTRSGRDARLDGQAADDWPNIFRTARFVPAVEYVQASRARAMAIEAMAKVFEAVDVIAVPTDGMQLVATNMTGHPAVIVPAGFRPADAPVPAKEDDGGGPGTPVSFTFLGRLDGEADLCALAKAWQDATGHHLKRPPIAG